MISRDSSVGIAMGYDRGCFPTRVRDFLLHEIQAGTGAHPASYPKGIGGFSPGSEADHSPPNSVEVKKT
jgi:hypothetical protein